MALPIDKQVNLVRGIVGNRATVTFSGEDNVIFVGDIVSDETKEQIEDAINPEKIWEPDSKVTRVDIRT